MKTWQSILLGMGIAVSILFSFWLGERQGEIRANKTVIKQNDTIIQRDTITVYKASLIAKERTNDTIRICVRDTIREKDTLFVLVEKERVVWRDSLCEVYASGYETSVDSVRHFTSSMFVERVVERKVYPKWSVGVTAGYGISSQGLSPYVGIGVSYNLFSF